MELIFAKTDKGYVAEFEVPADFNLHIERKKPTGTLRILQRGCPDGEYDTVCSAAGVETEVYDYDFGALVYPKWIKVVSSSEVIKGVVTFG